MSVMNVALLSWGRSWGCYHPFYDGSNIISPHHYVECNFFVITLLGMHRLSYDNTYYYY